MHDMITRDELLDLISVKKGPDGNWHISGVLTDVYGDVRGNIYGTVRGPVNDSVGSVRGYGGVRVHGDVDGTVGGTVRGNVYGNVYGIVGGTVGGTINGKHWQSAETSVEKLKRLVAEDADREQIIEAINQLEDS
jgi:hypothetical protein